MCKELQMYGRLLNMQMLHVRGSIERAAVTVTPDNFIAFSFSPQARPPAWHIIRLRRVLSNEMLLLTDNPWEGRPQRVMEVPCRC